jgi:hypothetical protein
MRGATPDKRSVLESGDARPDTAISTAKLAGHLRAQDRRQAPRVGRPSLQLPYLSLHWARQQEAPCDVTFVHIPPGPRAGGRLSEAELLRGAGLVLSYLLAYAQERDQAKSFAGESAADPAVAAGRP